MPADGDDRDRPRRGRSEQHGVRHELASASALQRRRGDRQHAHKSYPHTEQRAGRHTLVEPPRRERHDPERSRERENRRAPRWKERQRKTGERRESAHLQRSRYRDESHVRSRR